MREFLFGSTILFRCVRVRETTINPIGFKFNLKVEWKKIYSPISLKKLNFGIKNIFNMKPKVVKYRVYIEAMNQGIELRPFKIAIKKMNVIIIIKRWNNGESPKISIWISSRGLEAPNENKKKKKKRANDVCSKYMNHINYYF